MGYQQIQSTKPQTLAYALTKRLVQFASDSPLDDQLELEVEAQTAAGSSDRRLRRVRSTMVMKR